MDIEAQIKIIGEILITKGLISQIQIDSLKKKIQEDPQAQKKSFETLLIEEGHVSEEDILEVFSDFLGLSLSKLEGIEIDPEVISLVPAKFANRNQIIPIKLEGNVLTIALRDPFDISIIDELKTFTNYTIEPTVSSLKDIQKAIKVHYGTGAETVERLVQDSLNKEEDVRELDLDQPQDFSDDASMIKYVNQLLLDACQHRATDIHIEPFDTYLQIRYRVDGILQEAKTPKDVQKLHTAIISRFKVMANLNISERRRPQDGRCKVVVKGEEMDLRLATYPTLHGEGMSIRLLSRSSVMFGLEQLGFSETNFKLMSDLVKKPNGMVLVTGPTGSGKTTTLYSCMNFINDAKIKIVTLEDPVEYQLNGINQIQINPKVDLTFANGLRSILRQDPDVILVGEIRDSETAQIAVRAALTGHLLFSTLHTNNAYATITRLLDLGIEPYLLTNTLKAVIAQRLVRKICEECKKEYKPSEDILKTLLKSDSTKKMQFYRGEGCKACNHTGYRGRLAIFEFLSMDEQLSTLIVSEGSAQALKKRSESLGMQTLMQDGFQKVKEGLTTIDEVIRVAE